MRALAFEHLRPDPIGVYGDVLDGRGIAVDRIMLDEGEAIPDWRAYDFLVVMGAGANVWDHEEHPWIAYGLTPAWRRSASRSRTVTRRRPVSTIFSVRRSRNALLTASRDAPTQLASSSCESGSLTSMPRS